MKALFTSADEYLRQSSWKDLAVLKLCLLSLGLLIGMEIPKRGRKETRIAAALLFAATYIPLMVRYLRILLRAAREEA
ncbi:MAG: permease of phosphate ABC transporter [Angelakisella sp.]|jgi:hypothetical protein|nr:permease of phosphate ABC transporter [Angelakisella sp.]